MTSFFGPPGAPHNEIVIEPFHLRFDERNPESGPGSGATGVHDRTLALRYGQRMRDTLDTLAADGWEVLPQRVVVELRCSRAALGDPRSLSPGFVDRACTRFPVDAPPKVLLPSRLAPAEDAYQAGLADGLAVHETFHLATGTARRPQDEASLGWDWLDEAGAVQLERTLVPESRRTDGYVQSWLDHPQVPLDLDIELGGGYMAPVFVEVLRRRFGRAVLGELWHGGSTGTAIDALRVYCAARDLPFFTPDPREEDLFGAAYALPAFRPGDLLPGRRSGWDERALTWSYARPEEARGEQDFPLRWLACRYFRLLGAERHIEVSVVSGSSEPAFPGVRAELVPYGAESRAESTVVEHATDGGEHRTVVSLRSSEPLGAALLVVSNGTDEDAWCRVSARTV